MSIDGATRGGRLGSTSQYRLVPARKNRSRGRLGLENEPTAYAAAHRRVRVRSVATVSAVATVESIRSWRSRAAVSAFITGLALSNPAENARRFRECRPRHYPASLASDEGAFGSGTPHARHPPVTGPATNRLATILRSVVTCPLGPTGAAERGPALGTRVRGSRCRGGQGMWTQWTDMARYIELGNNANGKKVAGTVGQIR